MTTYIEYAGSLGEGRLTAHGVIVGIDWSNPDPDLAAWLIPAPELGYDFIVSQTLTEQEALEWKAIHNDSWIAV